MWTEAGESGPQEFAWRHAGEMLEIFAERRLVGEIESVCDLLYVLA